MYFAIIWKNKEMSLAELKLIKPENIVEVTNVLITFDTNNPEKLINLGWIIKWWKVINKSDIWTTLEWKKILWTKDKDFWLELKREYNIKRFKLVDRLKTDIEVKKKWVEIVRFHEQIWIVEWYQNIRLYEQIDFDKPSRSMKMGMMPAKLTHIMINIWLSLLEEDHEPYTIYDPFSGSWTTGFLTNYLWYNFIWSDIDISHLEINQKRRKNQLESNNKEFNIFQHDITQNISENQLKWNILIVSEGWLWPMLTDNTEKSEIPKFQNKVLELYKSFISTISKIKNENNIKAVFTIPYYINQDNFLEEEIKNFSEKKSRKFSSINEIYSREKQKIWRKIIILE